MSRKIHVDEIAEKVSKLCEKAALELPPDSLAALDKALAEESSERGKSFLRQYIENAAIAKNERIPICQDTGLAVFFVELGQDIVIEGGSFNEAIQKGVAKGYKDAYLRMSVLGDPLFERKNTGSNTPAVIHLELVPGDKLKIILCPKGGGSENMSALKMLKPSDGVAGLVDFVVRTVVSAGGNPCPPTIVGVGVGGNFEMSALLAKKALIRKIGEPNPDPRYAELEKEILAKLNASGVGPQGLGGDITAFAVHIEKLPCHFASLPVAVNLNCHVSRHAEALL